MTIPAPFLAAAFAILLMVSPNLYAEPFVSGFDRFAEHSAQAGRVLLTELSCTACHAGPKTLAPKRGPVLEGASKRYRHAWLRQFLLDPAATKPGTTMPQVMHQIDENARDQVVDQLLAYLALQSTPEPKVVSTSSYPVAVEFWNKGNQAKGRELYHQLGCVACHAMDDKFQPEKTLLSDLEKRLEKLDLDPEDMKELGLKIPKPVRSVPHGDLVAKYSRRSLSMFLIAPHLLRPSLRMPDLRVHPTDAAHLAAYLLRDKPLGPAVGQLQPSTESSVLAQQGAKQFRRLGCSQCHQVGAQKPEPPRAKPLTSISGLDGGCTAARPTGGAPHFPLSEAQRTALDVAVARPEPDDLLTLTMKQLNCFACHQRGDLGGVGPQRYQYFETVGHVDLGDEGRIPPPLDYVGAKLTRKWLENVFQGKGSVRPHFRARMPSYNALAKSLASQFKATDTHWDLTATPPEQESDAVAASNRWLEAKPRPSHIEQGRQLMDIGCVQCHPIGGEHLPGVIGVDLANLQERIEPAWLHAFLLDPAKLKSNTRMPTFFPGGRSSNQQIYGGDVDRQISAIWAYLNSPSRKLPDKLEQGKAHNFELKPADQPMVVRTFMKKAGTHAIAVGFPEQLHFAVDAERGVVTQLWKGRFLNAHSTWFNRFVPPTQPLGKVLVLPPSAIVGEGESPNNLLQRNDPWRLDYRGYELDKQRVPTFLYRRGDFQIRERLAPANGKMRRRIEVKGDPSKDSTLWISLAAQVVRLDGPNIAILPSQGRVVLQEDRRGQLVKRDSDTELLAPLPIRGGEGSLEATYQW